MPDAVPATDSVLVGRYRLVRPIARGGMAQVWEGHDEILDRPVAVKVLLAHLAADAVFLERFRREAIAAARLSHRNIIATYDTGSDGDVAFIVMELVRGSTLARLLADEGPLSAGHAVDIAAQTADALDYAHRAGIVHRDVKPANILLCDDGQVKVSDFGIAKAAIGADLTETGSVLGTMKYLSPEQVDGRPQDGRSDVYALGVVAYEMLAGQPPFTGDTELSTAIQHLQALPPRLRDVRPQVPKNLESIVLKAMAKTPDQRYPTAAALRDALRAADPGRGDATLLVPRRRSTVGESTVALPAGATAVSVTPRPARPRRDWIIPLVLIAAAAIVTGLMIFIVSGMKGTSNGGSSSVGTGGRLAVSSALAFDPPPGSGAEHDDELRNLFDNNPNTTWSTETYDSRQFGGLKQGVGFVLQLRTQQDLSKLTLATPSRGWSAAVYVAGAPGRSLADWGAPVASKTGISGQTTFDLQGKRAGAILVWITDLGDARVVSVAEASLSG